MATTVGSTNFFRAVGRLQLNLLDAEPGFFYAGTYLGKKKILSFGVSGDTQSSYHYVAADGFADLPLGPGVFTAQVNLAYWNGGTFLPAGIGKETGLMAEVGYNIFTTLSPIFHIEHLWGGTSDFPVTVADRTIVGGGLAFWPYGHNANLKAFYARNTEAGTAHGANQVNVQWQLYFF
jgi:hypothetical protein